MKYIIGGDWHFQYNQPVCRRDDFVQTQIKKMKWLNEMKEKYDAIILSAGDTTDKDILRTGSMVVKTVNMILKYCPMMNGIAGNHDLLYRNMNYLDDSIISNLIHAGIFNFIETGEYLRVVGDLIYGFNFGSPITPPQLKGENKTMCLTHQMVFETEKDGIANHTSGITAKELLTNHPEYDIIISSDHHKTFVEELDGRLLVNPGSFMRLTAGQADHRPCVFLYDSDTHELEKLFVPIEEGVISTEHLDVLKDKNARLDAFVSTVESEYEIGFSFEDNVETYFGINDIEEAVKILTYKFMED